MKVNELFSGEAYGSIDLFCTEYDILISWGFDVQSVFFLKTTNTLRNLKLKKLLSAAKILYFGMIIKTCKSAFSFFSEDLMTYLSR